MTDLFLGFPVSEYPVAALIAWARGDYGPAIDFARDRDLKHKQFLINHLGQ